MKVEDVCPHYPRGVPEGHRCDAKYVLIGEAPGDQEARQGLPFVGPSYRTQENGLAFWWSQPDIHLSREDFYITNVCQYQPPGNKLERLGEGELASARASLVDRLGRRLVSPNIVIPVGNTALYALTGYKEISKWRGSVLEADFSGNKFTSNEVPYERRLPNILGRPIKCVPSIHPASALRAPVLQKTCKYDWRRISREGKYSGIILPERTHRIFVSDSEFADLRNRAHMAGAVLTIDIETAPDGIICVGFALDALESFTILYDTPKHIAWIKELCELPCEKNLQRGLYDLYWLSWMGIYVSNWIWSVDAMFHALDPCAGPTAKSKAEEEGDESAAERKSRIKPYSLAYMASCFCEGYVFWKDEAKDSDEKEIGQRRPKGEHLRAFLTYNGKDDCYTSDLQVILKEKLKRAGKLPFYLKHYAKLYYPLLDLMLHGTRVNIVEAEKNNEYLAKQCQSIRDRVESLAGRTLHKVHVGAQWYKCSNCKGRHKKPICSKGGVLTPMDVKKVEGLAISPLQLKDYLYGKRLAKDTETGEVRKTGSLGLPPRRKHGQITTEEAALRSLRLSYPEKCGDVIDGVLEFRRYEKLGTFFKEGKVDPDGKLRCHYNLTILTGRLSSSGNPRGTGTNKQNIDRELRKFIYPDEGTVFLEADASQAEDRVVGVLTGDKGLIEIARSKPDEFDVHKYRAAKVYRVPEQEITEKQRYLGKRTKHAVNFGMGLKEGRFNASQFQRVLLTADEPMFLPAGECIELLEAMYEAPLRELHARIRRQIGDTRLMTNSWGRQINFYDDRLDDEAFKRGYAFLPQSSIGDLVNQWGLIATWNFIRHAGFRSHINEQEHDALMISAYPEEAYDIASFIEQSATRPRMYGLGDSVPAVELSIPWEYAIYTHWGKDKKAGLCYSWKKLPPRKEFDECFRDLMSKRTF